MKRVILFISVVLVLTGCTGGNEIPGDEPSLREIGFSAVKYLPSRSAPSDSPDFDGDARIYITGLYSGNNGVKYLYFVGEEFTRKTEDGLYFWGADPEIYYPPKGTMYFLGFSTSKPVEAKWDGTDNIEKLTLPFGDSLDGTDDVVFSNYLKVDCDKVAGAQILAFNHALAWLYFKIIPGDSTPEDVMTINSVTVHNVVLSGTLEITPAIADNVPEVSAVWSGTSTAADKEIPGFEASTLGTATVNIGNGLMVLPGSRTSFTINYNLKAGSGEFKNLTYTHRLNDADRWEMGKKYVYAITVSLDQIKIDVESTGNWATEGDVTE